MKKISTVVLTILCLLGLAGCGVDNKPTEGDNDIVVTGGGGDPAPPSQYHMKRFDAKDTLFSEIQIGYSNDFEDVRTLEGIVYGPTTSDKSKQEINIDKIQEYFLIMPYFDKVSDGIGNAYFLIDDKAYFIRTIEKFTLDSFDGMAYECDYEVYTDILVFFDR